METRIGVQRTRHTECSHVKHLFEAAKLSSSADLVSEFAISDKTLKGKHMSDVISGAHAVSEVFSSRCKHVLVLNDEDGV